MRPDNMPRPFDPEHGGECHAIVDWKQRAEAAESLLVEIANIMHHGGLLGKDETDVRRLTLPYWDKDQCDRLQREQPHA